MFQLVFSLKPDYLIDPTGEFALTIPVEYAMKNIIDFPALTRELGSIFHPIPVTVYTTPAFGGRTKVKSQFEDLACEVGMTVGAAATAVLAQVQQAVGNQEKGDKNEFKEVYNSIKESSNYPRGFTPRKNGTTSNNINNKSLLDKLREIESGLWKKIYKDGYDAYGNKISIHYFQSQSGKVFDVKIKPRWSN